MTQQEYENKIKELEKQIEELKNTKIEESQLKRWKPKYNEIYWLVEGGDIFNSHWFNDRGDKWRSLIGNCFETEKEAEEYKKQIEYTSRYKNYIDEHSDPIDWNDPKQNKYFAQYYYNNQEIQTDSFLYHKGQGTICASSEAIIWDAIHEIGEENFKRYVLEVK